MGTPAKRKKIVLTLEQKLKLIEEFENGETPLALAQKNKLGTQTVRDIIKAKEKIQAFVSYTDGCNPPTKRKSMKVSTFEGLDSYLLAWYNEKRESGVAITSAMFVEHAKNLHESLGLNGTFQASAGWFSRFKQRYGIMGEHSRSINRAGGAEAVDLFYREFQLLINSEQWHPDQIYCATEAGLYWKSLPQKNKPKEARVKTSNERISMLCCANASGTHKLKLALVGKAKQPRSCKSVLLDDLPVDYYDGKGSCMSEEIFQTWFQTRWIPEVNTFQTDKGLQPKAVLLLDASQFNLDETDLQSDDGCLVAKFLPYNVARSVQPMQRGVLSLIKLNYYKELETASMVSSNYNEKYWSLLDAMYAIGNCWSDITADTIKMSWNLVVPNLNETEPEPRTEQEVIYETTTEEWTELPYCGDTYVESEVGESYIKEDTELDIEISDEERNDKAIEPSTALTSVETLLGFVDQKRLTYDQQTALRQIRINVRKLKKSLKTQTC